MKYHSQNLLYCIIMLTTLLQQTEFISFSFPDDMEASVPTQNKDYVVVYGFNHDQCFHFNLNTA